MGPKDGWIIKKVRKCGTLMRKLRVNINSIYPIYISIYNIIKVQRKYNTAPNEKISQTKRVFKIM
jgi:hypothetical protein